MDHGLQRTADIVRLHNLCISRTDKSHLPLKH